MAGIFQDQAAIDAGDKIYASGIIWCIVLGHIWHFGAVNFSIEGDIGLGSVDGTFRGGGYTDTYDIDMTTHLRVKLGYEASERLNVFGSGGLSSSSHEYAYKYDVGDAESDTQTLIGWTIGTGLGFKFLKQTILNLEVIHDDYGKKEYYFPVADIQENARASANLLTISIVQQF